MNKCKLQMKTSKMQHLEESYEVEIYLFYWDRRFIIPFPRRVLLWSRDIIKPWEMGDCFMKHGGVENFMEFILREVLDVVKENNKKKKRVLGLNRKTMSVSLSDEDLSELREANR